VRSCSSARELLAAVAARNNVASFPERTLLFLDEIQESAAAIQWLREFKEEFPELRVIAAGSLLEVRLQERGFSFPVGRVTFRALHPLSFLEFLRATNRAVLAGQLEVAAAELDGPPQAIHDQALAALRDYLLVGGMPEAVARYADDSAPAALRQVHADLLQGFAEDIHKYGRGQGVAYLEAAFANLAQHYGKRFHYENFAPGYRSREMKTALGRLESAMIVTRVSPTSSTTLPLVARPRSAPKLLPLDVGLALDSIGLPFEVMRNAPLHTILDGRAAELFVGQQLLASQSGPREPLHFWVRETARANAEVDFVVPGPGVPIPVEVKSGSAGTLRSLHQFLSRSGLDNAVRLTTSRIADERTELRIAGDRLEYRLLTLPLYLAELVPEIARGMHGSGE